MNAKRRVEFSERLGRSESDDGREGGKGDWKEEIIGRKARKEGGD